MSEETAELIESVANTLRGMSMDRRIPEDARNHLAAQAARLDGIADVDDDD